MLAITIIICNSCDVIVDTPGHAALTKKSLLYEPDRSRVNDSGKTSKVIITELLHVYQLPLLSMLYIANG